MISHAAVDGRPRLLIADDNMAIRSALGISLGETFEVVGAAGDAEQAFELARSLQPAAAVIDVGMPKGGGLRAVRGIVEFSPMTAIVILSGDESDSVVRELMRVGAIAYCRKGVSPQDLSDSLTQAIEAHAAEVQPTP
jgi:DNA-binding NarL/FixJ family response regulator